MPEMLSNDSRNPENRQKGNGGVTLIGRLLVGLVLLATVVTVTWISRRKPVLTPPVEAPAQELSLQGGKMVRKGETNAFSGIMTENYPDGSPKSRSYLVLGKLHGVSEGWYTNGQLQVHEEFVEGVSDGIRKKWYPDGTPLSIAPIVKGKIHGTFQRFHENGKVAEQIEMKEGEAEGQSYAFYPSGFLKAAVRLQNGKVVEEKRWKDGEMPWDQPGSRK
jgi:hypothetical protein